MKKFDFAVQSITLITVVGLLLSSVFQNDMIGFISIVQFFLGAWQVLSCLVSLTQIKNADNRIKERYITYVVAVVVYFLPILFNNYLQVEGPLSMLYLFGPPWIIALYYYNICYLKLKIQKEKAHSFLDLN
ncbi:MAG: hypothetical protein ABI723_12525 [Bacteroidia bacterium]